MSAGLLRLENPIKFGEDGEEIEQSMDDMVNIALVFILNKLNEK